MLSNESDIITMTNQFAHTHAINFKEKVNLS